MIATSDTYIKIRSTSQHMRFNAETNAWERSDVTIDVHIDLDRVFNDVHYAVTRSKRGKVTRVRGAIEAKRVKT
jgi:hypothetical protein